MQNCIWPSWCRCHSLSLASVKSTLVLPFCYRLTPGSPWQRLLNVCVCVIVRSGSWFCVHSELDASTCGYDGHVRHQLGLHVGTPCHPAVVSQSECWQSARQCCWPRPRLCPFNAALCRPLTPQSGILHQWGYCGICYRSVVFSLTSGWQSEDECGLMRKNCYAHHNNINSCYAVLLALHRCGLLLHMWHM